MGSVWSEGPKKTGPWKVKYRDGTKDAKGRLRRLYLGTYYTAADRDRAIADQEATLEAADRQHRKANAAHLGYEDLLAEWAKHQLAIGKIQEAYEIEAKATLTRLFKAQGWATLADVTADAVETWRGSKPGGVGVRKPLSMLKRLVRWASRPPLRQRVDLEVLQIEVGKTTPKAEPKLLSDAQIRTAIARAYEMGESCGAIVEHLARFGCRSSEACKLKVRDWDPVARTIQHRKTKNGQPILPHPVADVEFARRLDRLTARRQPGDALYLNALGQPWGRNARKKYQQILDWYWMNVGINLPGADPEQRGIGCLKDYAISVMDQEGIDDATKALFTAHLDLTVYGRHYKKTNADQAAAAAAKLARRAAALTAVPVGAT
jgi:integrase